MRRKQIGNRAMQAPAPNRAAQAAKAKADFLHLDQRLDEALKETFPASDPIALTPQNGGFLVQSGSVDGDRVEESPRLAAADDGLPGSDRPNAQRMVQR